MFGDERTKGASRATAQAKGTAMSNRDDSGTLIATIPVLCGGVGILTAALIAGAMALLPPRPAQATPAFAAQTKLPCGKCHVNPAGGGPRTPFGNAFQKNGNKLK